MGNWKGENELGKRGMRKGREWRGIDGKQMVARIG